MVRFDISDDTPLGFKSDLFKKLSRQEQIEYMRDWFLERYEDPAERTPYESAEGGYQWIYGGPFDAEEELREAFEDCAKEGVIEEVADEFSGMDWTHTARAEDYDEYDYLIQFDDTVEDYELIVRLEVNLDLIKRLLDRTASFEPREQRFSNMMHFSFCITLLEAYLSDVFARAVMKSDETKIKYLKNEKDLSDKKFALGEVFEKFNSIDAEIRKQISKTSFHHIPRQKRIFADVLSVDFGDVAQLCEWVEKRHDFVHRGGMSTEGMKVSTSSEEIKDMIKQIKSFASSVDNQLTKLQLMESAPF